MLYIARTELFALNVFTKINDKNLETNMNQKKITFKKTSKTAGPQTSKFSNDEADAIVEDRKYHYIPQPPPPTDPPPAPAQPLQPVNPLASPKQTIQMKIVQNNHTQSQPPPQRSNSTPLSFAGEESWHSSNPVSIVAPADSNPPVAVKVEDVSTKSKTVFSEKTKLIKGKSINIEDEVEIYKEQLQNYLELCDAIGSPRWTPANIIDTLYVMIESLNLDVVAVALIDFTKEKKLSTVVTRGFKNQLTDNISAIWEKSVTEGPTISWNTLMMIASNTSNDLSKWVAKEGLDAIGYVPIHDNKTIFGFMFIGAHEKKAQSPLASSLLELCGGRLGITLMLRMLQGNWPAKT